MTMIKASKKTVAENPFFGKKFMLTLLQQGYKHNELQSYPQIASLLTNAYTEVKTLEDRQLFMTILFSIGDVSNRQHNLLLQSFKPEVIDNGGQGARLAFIHCLNWLLVYNSETNKLFYKYLTVIAEYSNFENIFVSQVRTDRKKGTLIGEVHVKADHKKVAQHLAKIIKSVKTPDIVHQQLAKFLPTPRLSKRSRDIVVTEKNRKRFSGAEVGAQVTVKKELKSHTLKALANRYDFVTELSTALNWEVIKYPNNTRFKGLEEYKAKYNKLTEAYLFATKEILNYSREQFIDWLNKLPSDARYRVQCRLFQKDEAKNLISRGKWVASWGDLAEAYTMWEKTKETAQEVLRTITPEEKKNMTVQEVKILEKAAKVNTGATKIIDLMSEFFKGGAERDINIKAQSILDRIKVEVPVLVIADVSGSMSSASVVHNGVGMRAQQVASYATTTFMLKNPNEALSNMFIRFSDSAEVVYDGSKGVDKSNRFMTGKEVIVPKLIDVKEDFLTNYKRIYQLLTTKGGTNFSSVAQGLKTWVDSAPELKTERIELINQYPVWLVVSDGDMNNMSSAAASMNDFKSKMLHYFGWSGVVVVWDVKSQESSSASKFESIDNVMYFGGFNEGILNNVFCNINDLDIIDVYLPLQTLMRSNRYEPVRQVLAEKVNSTLETSELLAE